MAKTSLITRIIIFSVFFIPNIFQGQVKVTPLPTNSDGIFNAAFYDQNEYHKVWLLRDGWYVYRENDPEKKFSISVPSIFEAEETLVYENKVTLTSEQVNNSQVILGFLGLNYSADISINGYSIFKHPGGSYPFEIKIPKDILKENTNNTVTIKVSKRLDSDSSIPSSQQFLFENIAGGLFRDIYIKVVPTFHISELNSNYTLDQNLSKALLNLHVSVESTSSRKNSVQNQNKDFIVRINLHANGAVTPTVKGDFVQSGTTTSSHEAKCQIEIPNPLLWSPESPNYYLCEISIVRDGQVIDKSTRQITFYRLDKDQSIFSLNGNPFSLKGTTYYPNETSIRYVNIYQRIKEDLTLIKSTGFNAVRFAKNYPNPYALKVCQEIGLIALIELPLNSIPEEILTKSEFVLSTDNFIKEMIDNYTKYSTTIIFGSGSSFLPNSYETENFIAKLSGTIKEKKFLTYSSFTGVQTSAITNLDFYGIELYSSPLDGIKDQLQKAIDQIGQESVFISEVTYPDYKGSLNGYLTKNTTDAQAKYFEGVIDLSRKLQISGFFINSLFSYNGSFASLYGGYTKNLSYKFGILDYSRNLNSITYKVILSKLTDDTKITIPIGTRKDDNPVIFILLALFLSIVMAVLINTKKKFREDCTRALLRPYNFFADIRDHRIITGIHTLLLILIEAGSGSLLITVLLFFLRTNILFEKILLSFDGHRTMKLFSYLAWNPVACFVIIFILFVIKVILLSLVIKAASFFIKTRVELPNIFFTVVWSFLPLSILLPVELILFKILATGNFVSEILLVLIFFFLWIIQRLLKGIYVIFDVRPFLVYLYSFLILIIFFGGIILKYQLSSSTLYYILNVLKQYKSMIL
jgi:beta-galactosidase